MKTTLMNNVKKATVTAVLGTALFVGTATADAADMSRGANNFYTSEKVNVETVKFNNMYGMEIVGTLFTPKQMDNGKKYPALVVGHPFAAVRQQAANLYATKMAEAGFVTLSFDQMFWGESGGSPRGAVLPDLYVESFSAGVDYLGTRPFIDREKIGVIGICGSGGFAIAATKIDPRIKALATVSMYDMGEYFRTGLNRTRTAETRNKDLQTTAEQRYTAFESGTPVTAPDRTTPYSPKRRNPTIFTRRKGARWLPTTAEPRPPATRSS